MAMPGRTFSASREYRYGFNGKENDKAVSEGVQDYGMRIYDARIGKFLSVDPLTKFYPMLTCYQYASNNPIKFIDLDGMEGTDNALLYFKDRPQLDMLLAPSGSPKNAAGFARNKNWFWETFLAEHPSAISANNKTLINSGYSPFVDEIWIKEFKTDANYWGNRLIHHHIDGENLAVGIPEQMHWDNFKELHAYLYKGKTSVTGAKVGRFANGIIGVLANSGDIIGFFSGNPESWMAQFSGIDNPEEHIDEVMKQSETGYYFEIRSCIIEREGTYNDKGALISSRITRKTLVVDFFSDFIYDDENERYRGINKTNTNTEVWDYDNKGKRISKVIPDIKLQNIL